MSTPKDDPNQLESVTVQPRKKKIAIVILGILLLLGVAGGTATWYFMFRKNPESVAKIEQINETQENLDEALGWDDETETAEQ